MFAATNLVSRDGTSATRGEGDRDRFILFPSHCPVYQMKLVDFEDYLVLRHDELAIAMSVLEKLYVCGIEDDEQQGTTRELLYLPGELLLSCSYV